MKNVHVPCVMTNTDSFYVKVCGCGAVHLNFGATLLSLSPEALVAVSDTLHEVAQGIRFRLKEDPVNAEAATLDLSGNVIRGHFSR